MKLSELIREELRISAETGTDLPKAIIDRLHECVKPLEWDGGEENCYSIADTGSRYYEVAVVDGLERPCDYVWSSTYTERGEFVLGLGAGSFEAAKAAAQAHYAAQAIQGLNL